MKINSEQKFGVLFSIIFFIIGIFPLLNSDSIRIHFIVISLVFLTLTFVYSQALKPMNQAWVKFGEILGRIIAPLVMAIVYFIILTPLSFLIRIFGKDLLNLKFSNRISSYWIKRKKDLGPMKKQF